MPFRRSPTSWYTPSPDAALHVPPVGHPLERGWVGRIDGDRVLQLAAQTLQSFFTGGGTAREHAEYPLHDVVLLAPVLHPPSVRLFDEPGVVRVREPGGDRRARARDRLRRSRSQALDRGRRESRP